MSDFIKVNFPETPTLFATEYIVPKESIILFAIKQIDKYEVRSKEIGEREITREEYDRLCKELGVQDEG